MSVIGRLDQQVEALLINPLKKRQSPDGEEPEGSALPAPATEERDAESPEEKREADSTLPVWLL